MSPRPLPPASYLGVLFIATGATALLVEQAFEKLLSTVVGSSTEAGAIVLAVYFGGLSLGGIAYGALEKRAKTPLHLYAALEGLVGVTALVLGLFFERIQELSAVLVQSAGAHPASVLLARLAVAAAWILPPTIAMGATYPTIVGALQSFAARTRVSTTISVAMARLYACNLFGACAAAFAGPYAVFPVLGITGALVAAAGLQALVVAGALVLARRVATATLTAAGNQDHVAPQAPAAAASRLVLGSGLQTLLVMAFASGFVIFALEVVWIHLIGATLGMSVYAFAMMLTLVLLGLFIGGSLVGVISRDGEPHRDFVLPALLVLASGAVLATASQWDDAPLWLLQLGKNVNDFGTGEAVRFQIAALLVGIPSIALGAIYPSLFRSRLFPAAAADRAAGWLAAVNAVGSIGGALAGAFYLLPQAGSEASLRGLGLAPVTLAVPLALALAPKPKRLRIAGAALAAVVAAAVVVATLPAWNRLNLTAGVNVYFRRSFVAADSKLASWFEDAAGGITTVVDTPHQNARATRTLLTNGKFQGNDDGEVIDQITFGLVPSALTEKRERALVIGLGTGQSASVLGAAGFKAIDIADISPGIRGAARGYFKHINGGILDDERVHFHLEDGRNHLLRTADRYDVISMELTSVWFAGASNLYSREFYALAKKRLQPGGILQQWVQLHHASPDEVMSILATVRSVFPSVSLWMLNSQGCIIAADDPRLPLPAAVSALEARPAMAPLLATVFRGGGLSLKNLSDGRFLDEPSITRVAAAVAAAGIPLNTDGNRYLEYATPRHNLEKLPHQEIVMRKLLEYVAPADRQQKVNRYGMLQAR